jgi:protein pelota
VPRQETTSIIGERMKLKSRDVNLWKLFIDSEDDLWVLARLCATGIHFSMLGERRDQTTAGGEGERAKQAERKKMMITLAVENVEHQSFSDTLRVHGIIRQAPIDIGSHHTHIVTKGDEVTLTNEKGFSSLDEALLNDAIRASNAPQVALLVVEQDEMILYFVTNRGLRESAQWTMRGGGKRITSKEAGSVLNQFQTNVVEKILQQLEDTMPLILCGPGHFRENVAKLFNSQGHQRTIKSVATSMGGRAAANEVLSQGLASSILSEHQMSREILLLEEVWTRMATNNLVAIGEVELEDALQRGAIETLLIIADTLREEEIRSFGSTWLEWTEQLSEIGADIVQCSVDHDAGQQLANFGGVAALLRY